MAVDMTPNPLSTLKVNTNPTNATGALPTNLGVTAGSAPGSGSLFQGNALPNITTTNQSVTSTPQFYTNYLNQLATQGAAAAQNAQFAGPSDLQKEAFNKAQSDVGNYQSALQQAQNLANSVGNSDIVNALSNLNANNIANNFAPGATAGIVGSGQFGSQRGAQALGQVINNANIATQAQQAQAMQQDYANRLNAANQLNSIAGQTQALGLGDVNALSTLGAQQQTIAQNQQLFPLQTLQAQANLLKGATIPTATSSSYTGPIPGAYQNSPLSQIAGVGSTLLGTGLGTTLFGDKNSSGLIGKGLDAAGKAIGSIFDTPVSDATKAARDASGTSGINDVGTPVQPLPDPSLPTGPDGSIDYSGGGWGTGAGTDWGSIDFGGPVDNSVPLDIVP